ncbi:hypothetical protein NLO98_17940 [Pseudomonas syringae]|nr:hypothetical protein [Pseudomonas syringae]
MRLFAGFTLLSASLLSLTACAAQPSATSSSTLTAAEIAGQPAHLSDGQGRCVLTRKGSAALTLDMQWPCRFSEDRQHKVRVEDFRKALIVMVERSEPMPPPSTDCLTDLQPVRFYKGKLEAAPVSRIAACGPGFWDQKTFTWQFDW